jgi:hypothetical protein
MVDGTGEKATPNGSLEGPLREDRDAYTEAKGGFIEATLKRAHDVRNT